VHYDYLNVQGQVRMVWPASFSLARAYLDQLEREQGLDAARISAARKALATAEKASGARQQEALAALATELDGEAGGSGDAGKVRVAAGAVRDLASTKTALH
jgi:spore germination cell wall hydrolase CwlJ-like protein